LKNASKAMGYDNLHINQKFEIIKNKAFQFFRDEIEHQILVKIKRKTLNLIENSITPRGVRDISIALHQLLDSGEIDAISSTIRNYLEQTQEDYNYTNLLKVFENKGIYNNCNIKDLTDLEKKKYYDYVIRLIKLNTLEGQNVKNIIKQNINLCNDFE